MNTTTQAVTKTIRLHELSLEHFKGLKRFELNLSGKNVSIYGDNGTGKTTLYDAYCWLLWGKDSQGAANFGIKSLDSMGEAAHNLEHDVAAKLDFGAEVIEVEKVYREIWTRRRGSAAREFTGHTVEHFVNGVLMSAGNYADFLSYLGEERTLRLLTDPSYFSEDLHWSERRLLLLDVCGDISDSDVIVSSVELSRLPELLGDRSLDDFRAIATARKTKINQELDRLPVRIDEASNSLPDVDADREPLIKAALDQARENIRELEAERTRVTQGGQTAELRRKLAEIEKLMLELQTREKRMGESRINEVKDRLRGIEAKIDDLEVKNRNRELKSRQAIEEIARLEKQRDELYAEWKIIDSARMKSKVETVCPACEQELPAEKVAEAREKALATFNREKALRLEINHERRDQVESKIKVQRRIVEEHSAKLHPPDDLITERKALQEEVRQIEDAPLEKSPELIKLRDQQSDLLRRIEALKESAKPELERIESEIAQLRERENELVDQLGRFRNALKIQGRISELETEQRALAAEFEELEAGLYLCDQFIRRKVSMLEGRVNERFELARFRLFEEQISGGLREVCETTCDGVPWHDLNHGNEIRVGMDVIRTLQQHFNLALPVWVDQCESVTSLPEMDCQVIRLVVSKPDKQLRIEKESR